MAHQYLQEGQKRHCCLSCSDLLPPPIKHTSSRARSGRCKAVTARCPCLSARKGRGAGAQQQSQQRDTICLLRAPHPQWTCSSLRSFTGKRVSWAPERQPPPQGTYSLRVSGLSPAISVQTGKRHLVWELPPAAPGWQQGGGWGSSAARHPGSSSPAARRLRLPTGRSC